MAFAEADDEADYDRAVAEADDAFADEDEAVVAADDKIFRHSNCNFDGYSSVVVVADDDDFPSPRHSDGC